MIQRKSPVLKLPPVRAFLVVPSTSATLTLEAVGNVNVTVAAAAPTVPWEFCALKEKVLVPGVVAEALKPPCGSTESVSPAPAVTLAAFTGRGDPNASLQP